MVITLHEFNKAINMLKPFVVKTKMEKWKNNIYLKKESSQVTGSFKWRGVLYSVMNAFENLQHVPTDETKPYYLVTQSTGNHGIALIHGVHLMKTHYCEKYPTQRKKWESIYPCIFGNQYIQQSKFEKIHDELLQYGEKNESLFDCSSINYSEALNKRETFLLTNQGQYMSHGGKDIMTGYGSLAQEVIDQIPKGKSVTMITAIGAGGPIGIGAYFQYFPNFKLVVCQTNDFNAFVRSLQSGKIEYNDCNSSPGLSDGIAVDKPELYALQTALELNIKGGSVKNKHVKKIHKETGLGGSSCIALAALEEMQINSDIIVVLDCEGNYERKH